MTDKYRIVAETEIPSSTSGVPKTGSWLVSFYTPAGLLETRVIVSDNWEKADKQKLIEQVLTIKS